MIPIEILSAITEAVLGYVLDQSGLALRVGTAVRDREVTAQERLCFGVLLDGIREVLYNDHACRIPPLVVRPTSSKPQREVLFFLLVGPLLSMQVPVPSSPAALVILLLSFLYYPNNVAASPLLPSFNRDPIVLSGQDWLYFGQRIWPVTSGLSGTFHTLSLHHPHGVHLLDPLGWRQHGFSTDGTGERTEADDLHRIPAPSLKILA